MGKNIPPARVPAAPSAIPLHQDSFGSMIDELVDGVYFADVLGLNVFYVNRAISRMLGYRSQELLKNKQLWAASVHEKDRTNVSSAIRDAAKDQASLDIIHRMITSEGRIIWVMHTIRWEKDPTGKGTLLLGVLQNITDKKEAEDKFQQLFRFSSFPMIEQDMFALRRHLLTLGKEPGFSVQAFFAEHPEELKKCASLVEVTDVNPAMIKLFDAQTPEEFLQAYRKSFCRESDEMFIKELEAIFIGKVSFASSVICLSLEGRTLRIDYKWAVPHMYESTFEKVLITCIDTTQQSKLAQIMNLKDHAIESSKSGIVITDLQGNITYANDSFHFLFAFTSQKEILGSNIKNFFPHRKEAMHILQHLHLKKEWQGEIVIKVAEDDLNLETQARVAMDEYGVELGLVFSFIDITEHIKTEQIRLEFTNIAAHELKTPLTPLKTFLALLGEHPRKYGLTAEAKKYVKVCMRNVYRLNNLVGDILDISKLEAGGMKFNMRRMNLLTVLNQEIVDFQKEAEKKGLQCRSKLPKKLPLVVGDQGRLIQVIGNLLRNAIKFTQKGKITITASHRDDHITISIIDTGMGIKKGDIRHLFTKFFQAQDITTRGTKGSGLGLAISKKIILAHQGTITASSRGKGKGSTFNLTLPCKGVAITKQTESPRRGAITSTDEKTLVGRTQHK